jgi:hypothetical protein
MASMRVAEKVSKRDAVAPQKEMAAKDATAEETLMHGTAVYHAETVPEGNFGQALSMPDFFFWVVLRIAGDAPSIFMES